MEQPCAQGNLDNRQWAALRLADSMTREVEVDDNVFGALKGVGFGDSEIVELVVTIAAYNCVSRVLVALDIGGRNSVGMTRSDSASGHQR
jgi:alkylhydroperoxidase family enzyme